MISPIVPIRVFLVLLLTAFPLAVFAASVSLGTNALNNSSGTDNVAVGDHALYSNTTYTAGTKVNSECLKLRTHLLG